MRPETYRASLDMIKKEPKENLHEYAAKVREIMAKAYPGLEGSELFTEMLVERIVKGLPDTNLVYDVLSKKPKTVQAVLDLIEWHECIKAYKKKPNSVRRVVSEGETSTEKPEKEVYVTEHRLEEMCRDIKETFKNMLQSGINHVPQGVADKCNYMGPQYLQCRVDRLDTSEGYDPMVGNARQETMVPGKGTARHDTLVPGKGTARRDTMVLGRGTARHILFGNDRSAKREITHVSREGNARQSTMAPTEELRDNTRDATRQFNGECFSCHNFGHMARHCQTKNYQGRLN